MRYEKNDGPAEPDQVPLKKRFKRYQHTQIIKQASSCLAIN
jgi:hypothetical protein